MGNSGSSRISARLSRTEITLGRRDSSRLFGNGSGQLRRDVSSKVHCPSLPPSRFIRRDGERKIIALYDISNSRVCTCACTLCIFRFLVSHARRGRKVPPVVLLVGNKADLSCSPGERVVSALEGQKRAKEIEAHAFHEISVRESVDQVMTYVQISWIVFTLGKE